MSILSIAILVFIIMESANVAILYFWPDSRLGNGGASYIARCIGADRRDRAAQTLTIGLELLLISDLFLTILGTIFIDPIVGLLGAKENTFQYTKDYCIVMILGSVFTMSNYAVGQLLRSEGSTVYSMIGMISGTVANIILDPIFIFTLKIQIKGAAIASKKSCWWASPTHWNNSLPLQL